MTTNISKIIADVLFYYICTDVTIRDSYDSNTDVRLQPSYLCGKPTCMSSSNFKISSNIEQPANETSISLHSCSDKLRWPNAGETTGTAKLWAICFEF